ncbi:flavodoxin [Clostridium sp. Marseille-P3244]|uniref:flavodoxin n=1 Tax=Clostridium sp. Marseille-P3244 TaxID=1871020 RepID=UPI000931D1DF|nr:flavodoxin [Clostridium sp. Marseille-P3244]
MKVKKILSMILVGAAAMSLMAGCGSDQESGQADTAAGSSNVLVVYYSATGNTEEVANIIADTTGGDLFELEPAEPYTDADLDWTDENSRVTQEHEDESLRDVELVSTTVDNWESYDTVFIGYPIWWGIAAWPVDSFVENNDFSGKTVIPFCTSASSSIGDSGNLLEEMAGTGEWQEGERFRSGADEADVQAWIEGLNL